MNEMVEIVDVPIETQRLLESVRSADAGAVVLFLGTTRRWTDGCETESLDYEAYTEMAEARLRQLASEARRRWPIVACAIAHRVGRVPLSEASVAVAVSTPHRQAAFEAAQWLIDTLKEDVPIWKRDNRPDGRSVWIHPGIVGRSDDPESESP